MSNHPTNGFLNLIATAFSEVLVGLVLLGIQSNPVSAAQARLQLSAPFRQPALFASPIGVDHKRGKGTNDADCQNYRGLPFPTCYRGHTGTDFLMAGGYATMDLGSLGVVAAAPGVIHKIDDGHFDRCIADPFKGTINCDGSYGKNQAANYVVVKQNDGLYASYYHLQKGSVAVKVGQSVQCGQLLGRVGSSGVSAFPHLHFHFSHDAEPAAAGIIDPYQAGLWKTMNASGVPTGTCPVSFIQPPAPQQTVQQTVKQTADTLSYNIQSLLNNVTGSAIQDGNYYLRLVKGSKYLDVSGSCVGQNGCKVQLWDVGSSTSNNIFTVQKQLAGGYKLFNTNKALEVRAEELGQNGGKVQVWDSNVGPHQTWLFYHVDGSKFIVRNAASLKVLDADGTCTGTNGCSVTQRDAQNSDPTQVWTLERR
jgi:murein DD-endopeptidase MepM/ murein hydrolase activator NlpD